MSRYVTEFIGTFFLVLTIGLTAVSAAPTAPLAIGSVLMVMIYMGGHVSGAHYNPAVTLALVWRGATPAGDLMPYMVAQIAGALAAALGVAVLTGETFMPAPASDVSLLAFGGAEFLFTFALVLVILHVATAPDTQGNQYYGLAIGFTVLAGAYAVGPVSGAAFNPAVVVGPMLVAAVHGLDVSLADLVVYLVATLGGALAAVPVYRMQMGDET